MINLQLMIPRIILQWSEEGITSNSKHLWEGKHGKFHRGKSYQIEHVVRSGNERPLKESFGKCLIA